MIKHKVIGVYSNFCLEVFKTSQNRALFWKVKLVGITNLVNEKLALF